MDRALFHCCSSYSVPNVRVRGHICKTNLPSKTAFRGFGAPQAMMIAENIMTDMAETLGIPAVKVCILKHINILSDPLRQISQ